MVIRNTYRLFILLNVSVVFFVIVILFLAMNGENNETPWFHILASFTVALPIIIFQYPLLLIRKNWYYKSLVFYLSMILFLFLLGGIISWNQTVGNNEAGTWLVRADAGLRMLIVGQIFGGIFGFVLIVFMNYLMTEKLFNQDT